jgi:hypothetical protein
VAASASAGSVGVAVFASASTVSVSLIVAGSRRALTNSWLRL